MSLWTSAEIADVAEGVAERDFAVTGVTFDSREVEQGDLFIALKGEATNGHRFVEGAFERGASGAIVSESVNGPHVRVTDTFEALNDLGRASTRAQ